LFEFIKFDLLEFREILTDLIKDILYICISYKNIFIFDIFDIVSFFANIFNDKNVIGLNISYEIYSLNFILDVD